MGATTEDVAEVEATSKVLTDGGAMIMRTTTMSVVIVAEGMMIGILITIAGSRCKGA